MNRQSSKKSNAMGYQKSPTLSSNNYKKNVGVGEDNVNGDEISEPVENAVIEPVQLHIVKQRLQKKLQLLEVLEVPEVMEVQRVLPPLVDQEDERIPSRIEKILKMNRSSGVGIFSMEDVFVDENNSFQMERLAFKK
ncbi:hypothetical protein Tco_0635598 [Tanacetum coccineum]